MAQLDLKPTPEGHVTDDTRESIERLLTESDDIENPSIFWAGFCHGVAAFLVDNGITTHTVKPDSG